MLTRDHLQIGISVLELVNLESANRFSWSTVNSLVQIIKLYLESCESDRPVQNAQLLVLLLEVSGCHLVHTTLYGFQEGIMGEHILELC